MRIEKSNLMLIAAGLLLVMAGACGAVQQAHKPGCEPKDLAALEAEYVTEATAACRAEGAHSTAECKSFPSIRDKYAAKRARYVACDGAGGAP